MNSSIENPEKATPTITPLNPGGTPEKQRLGLEKMIHDSTSGVAAISLDLKERTYDRPKRWYKKLSIVDKIKVTAAFFLTFGTVGIYFTESDVAASNIKTLADAAWWCIVTMGTVGYGDKYPVTDLGRIIAAIVILGGCTTFALMVGYVGGSLVDKEKATNNEVDTIEELAGMIKRLEEKIDKMEE